MLAGKGDEATVTEAHQSTAVRSDPDRSVGFARNAPDDVARQPVRCVEGRETTIFEAAQTCGSSSDPETSVLVLGDIGYKVVRQSVLGGVGCEAIFCEVGQSGSRAKPQVAMMIRNHAENEANRLPFLLG